MKPESWAYVCGLCAAREAEFLPARIIQEFAALAPGEVSSRLARSHFGPAEPLSSFDLLARERRRREFHEIESLSPDSRPVDLVRLRFAADEMRKGLGEIPVSAGPTELVLGLSRLCLGAGDLADELAAELAPPLPPVEGSTRVAASLLLDSAELSVALRLARLSGDDVLERWARARARLGAAKVALRAVRLRLPRETVGSCFFGRLPADEGAREFLRDYDGPAAVKLRPPGSRGREDEFLLALSAESRAEPFSAARVLHYLFGFLKQEKLLRLAVYASLGKLPAEEAA